MSVYYYTIFFQSGKKLVSYTKKQITMSKPTIIVFNSRKECIQIAAESRRQNLKNKTEYDE